MDANKNILSEELEKELEKKDISLENEVEMKKTEIIRSIARRAGEGFFYIIISFLLGTAEIFFGATPFGVALLSASSRGVAYIFIGLCIAAIASGESIAVLIATYTVIVLIRVMTRIVIDNVPLKHKKEDIKATLGELFPLLFSENICLRMATSCIGAFIIGLYTLIGGGFLYYDLWGAILGMIIAPAAVLLYFGILGGERVSEHVRFISFCALLASVIFAAREMSLFGLSPALCGAMAYTLYFCRKRGFIESLIVGAVAGLAYSPVLAPLFVLSALSVFLLKRVSFFFACLSAAVIGISWSLFAVGISALTSALPSILITCLLFSVIDKLYLSNEGERLSTRKSVAVSAPVCRALDEGALDAVILNDTEQKIKVMCETFSSLSTLFYSISERMRRPASQDMKEICDSAFDAFCCTCENRASCWEVEYAHSLAALGALSSALTQNGHVTADDMSKRMRERCHSIPDMLEQINRNAMLHMQQLMIGDKTEIFALDYEAVSELLAGAMVDQRDEYGVLPELTREVCKRLSSMSIGIDGALVFGDMRKKAVLLRATKPSAIYANIDLIRAELEELCGTRLEYVERKYEEGRAEALFVTAKRYTVEYVKRSLKAEGEEGFCGDTINIFENGQDRFYSFISDGMGSGREAALTSGICSVFLSRILNTTSKCEVSLNMLNGFLRNKGGGSMHECSATVDLMELDLITGSAEFYKGGAAPSYVYRDTNLYKLRSNSVPLGIIKELDTRKIAFELADGDVVVMVSDGVTQSRDECPWLFDLLRENVGKESLASISDAIVKRAKYEGADDDISVVVMRILKR